MKLGILFLACLLTSQVVQAQNFAEGFVFQDQNQNGKKDAKEIGLAQVAVSNGREVVLTDTKGYYKIPVGKDQIIFVIKPADFRLPVDAFGKPQFYYIHKPEGSPLSKYAGVSPTGKLPKELNFPLIANPEDRNFSSLVFGDSQVYTKQEVEFFKNTVIRELKGHTGKAQFGITLGDLVGDDLSLHPDYQSAIAMLDLPWFQVIGNHDLNFDALADSLADETFEKNFGPSTYSFNYGNAHFINIDDIIYPRPDGQKGYIGGMRQDQLDFIENDLTYIPKDKLIVLSYHIPLFANSDVFRAEDRARLFSILKDFPNIIAFSAHTHFQRHNLYTAADGWEGQKPLLEFNLGTTCGDWYSGKIDSLDAPSSLMRDGTPKGYLFFNVQDNSYDFDYKVIGKPATYQIELTAPSLISAAQSQRYPIYANFFIGHQGDRVEFRVGDSAWKAMNNVDEYDPSYMRALYDWDDASSLLSGKRPSDPELSILY